MPLRYIFLADIKSNFEPDYFLDFGYEYDQFAYCPEGTWANGYRQKVIILSSFFSPSNSMFRKYKQLT